MDQKKIDQLETFFAASALPDSIDLGPGETISNLPKFLGSHFTALKANCPACLAEVYAERLLKLKSLL